MVLLLLLALAALGWAWWSGWLGSKPGRKIAIIAGALLSAYLLLRGQMTIGAVLGAATTAFALARSLWPKGAPVAMDVSEARRLLGLSPNAGAEEIRAAHRRLIAQVHPDKGGSAELARQVNTARDRLLQALEDGR